MHPPDYNLSYLENCLEDLQTYLLQAELFWPLATPAGAYPEFPRMTLANVLLAFNQVEAQEKQLQSTQRALAENLRIRWEALVAKWQVAVETKAIAEMGARLNLWSAYTLDLEEGRREAAYYRQEVRQRVRFELLLSLIEPATPPEPTLEQMQAVDQRMLALTVPASFIWDEALEPLYPRDGFAFLYRTPHPPAV
jgi:hypothetical protein